MINYIIKRIIDTELSVKSTVYGNNIDETKTNYGDKNKIDYGDFENVNLEITCNDTLVLIFSLVENPIPKEIASIIEFNII